MTPQTTAAAPSGAIALRRVALIGRRAGADLTEPLSRLAAFLAASGHEVLIEEETARATPLPAYRAAAPEALAANADVAIVVGGDGTMLGIARRLAPLNIPVIGINQGRLGFLTDIPIARMEPAVAAILGGRYVEERRTLLTAEVVRADGTRESALALNDVVLNRGGGGTMIECAVEIDGRFVYVMRADGVIVATPTGSTAYSFSAGGPIVSPDVACIVVTPVAAHMVFDRSLVLSADEHVRLEVVGEEPGLLSADGRGSLELPVGGSVGIGRAANPARLVRRDDAPAFHALVRDKFDLPEGERTPPGV
jgi:NAD+ kinase